MTNNMIDVSQNIYRYLADDKSKYIFARRLMYSVTSDDRYLGEIINSLDQKSTIDHLIEECMSVSNQLIIYGAGNDLELISRLYPKLDCRYLCDRDVNKQKTGWRGKTVISPERLFAESNEFYIMINSSGFYREINDMLIEQGIPKERIINLGSILGSIYDTQYFEPEIMIPSDNEIFIDGGCYNCYTDKLFINWCKGNYKKIYAFEPDQNNYQLCISEQKRHKIEKLNLINKGLWDCEETLFFDERATQGSRIDYNESSCSNRIDTTSIDLTVGDDKVTFIKLDVEGAELKALQGARNTIMKNHPKLAISIYHKDEDVITIPEYILSLSTEYRFYIRHYQLSANETILYAT